MLDSPKRLPTDSPIVHDGLMFTSEAVTRNIRVSVLAEYAPDRSEPSQNQWFFLYTITIANEGDDTVQLLTRHWIMSAADAIRHDGGHVSDGESGV
jgi:uncharacterized protein affecting Mg2+/Co2+ transport